MYESFYNLSEKPFTLLPDPSFLYMSDKHRMALTLLEYGLMNHAGFTVISGAIGAGKTTLIRHVLNNMDREHTVGLITNTHRDFGELLQWTLLAFNLEHSGMNKVEMYQRFVDFIIDEYAHNRRTVLIVDEAQNMAPETLEELRMLSNINADKNQALQVVLVGQQELRDTLKRPDLAQFAQRISVDYHLQALSENETAGYIRHRMGVAGGDPDTFTEIACKAVHRYSGGVPRLINLLCDTALVYGFAEQEHRIDARLVTDVAREKQAGGIFPTFDEAGLEEIVEPDIAPEEPAPVQQAETAAGLQEEPSEPVPAPATIEPVDMEQPVVPVSQESIEVATQTEEPVVGLQPVQSTTAEDSAPKPEPEETHNTLSEAEHRWKYGDPKKKVRVAVFSAHTGLRQYLSRLLESYGLDAVTALPLTSKHLATINPEQVDVLLIDRPEDTEFRLKELSEALAQWRGAILYNDSMATEINLQKGNPNFGKVLVHKIKSLAGTTGTVSAAVNH